MSRIVAIDECVVPYRPDDVQPVLLDVHRYGEWWPRPWRVTALSDPPIAVGSRFRVVDGWLLRWEATLAVIEPGRIALSIDGGDLSGAGRWGLREVIDGTAVLFRMDVDPRPAWLRLLTWRVDLRQRQARHMRRVFTALGERLATLGVERVPEPERPEDRPPQPLMR